MPQEIELERYYPPTVDKITTAYQDIGWLASHSDAEIRYEGFRDITLAVRRAITFYNDNDPKINVYTQIEQLAQTHANEAREKLVYHVSHS